MKDMSNPEQTAATQIDDTKQTLTPEEELEIAKKRQKDTQAAYTKGQQTLKQKAAEIEALKQLLTPQVEITDEEKAELDDLMYSDPAAWRQKLNAIESRAKAELDTKITEKLQAAGNSASASFELERRAQVLKEFNDSNGLEITDELIANEIPPRIQNKLANGEIEFEDFLEEVKTYVTTGKVVKDEKVNNGPNLNTVGGSNNPSKDSNEPSLSEAYANDIY